MHVTQQVQALHDLAKCVCQPVDIAVWSIAGTQLTPAAHHLYYTAQEFFSTKPCVVQAFELRMWPHQHPLRQFEGILAQELLFKMEDRGLWMERLQVPTLTLLTACLLSSDCFKQ